MKEITRINLASVPYNVEIEAKKELERYCEDIQHNLGADTDAMREIEARMTELLAERGVVGEKVIRSEDIKALRAQLGDAADFASDDESATQTVSGEEKPARRLMRDTTNRILGGVCSGLGYYFNVDPLVIRLAAVALTLLSAGSGIIVYLLLWALVPPARSAADRLQMAGKQVNITTIKDETSVVQPSREPMLVIFLRYMTAGLLVLGALGTLATLAFATLKEAPGVFSQSPRYIIFTIVAALAGVFLASLLSLLAYALLAKKFNQKMGISLIAIMVAGLSSYVIGIAGLRYTLDAPMDMAQTTRQIAVNDLLGIKSMTIESSGNAAVSYNTTTARAGGSILYPQGYKDGDVPRVTLTRNGDSVTLKIVGGKAQECHEGCMVWVDVSGPILERISVNNSRLVYSQQSEQTSSLSLSASGNANVILSSASQFETVTFDASESSSVDMAAASVVNVNGALAQAASVRLGNVKNVEFTVPGVCPADQENIPAAEYASVINMKVNGVVYDPSAQLPCFRVSHISD